MRAARAILVVAALSILLAACGSTSAAARSRPPARDRGPSPTDPARSSRPTRRPTRIIAHAGEAAALMSFGIRPVGIYADESVKTDPNLKDLDLTGIEILGEEWGKIDVEKAAGAAAGPDRRRLVAGREGAQRPGGGRRREEQEARRAGAGGRGHPGQVHRRPGRGLRGSSPRAWAPTSTRRADRRRTSSASRQPSSGSRRRSRPSPASPPRRCRPPTTWSTWPTPSTRPSCWTSRAGAWSVINPDKPDPGFPYWENLSWENADKYQPDLILCDGRSYTPTVNEEWGKKQPTWFAIRAAKAGAVVSWPAYWLHTYGHFATELDQLTDGDQGGRPEHRRLTRRCSSSAPALGSRRAPALAAGLVVPGCRSSSWSPSSASPWARGTSAWPRCCARWPAWAPAGRSTTPSPSSCGCRARCSASSPARPSASPARSCRASPATRWPTPGSWASTPARRRSWSSPSPCSAYAAIGYYVWFAFAGAIAAIVLVYAVASLGREGATPVKLALAGAAVTAGLASVTTGIVMTNMDALNELRFWQVGSLAGRYAPILVGVAPFLVVGLVASLAFGRVLNGLALGEDTARGLGQRVGLTRAAAFGVVAVLAGAATAACGPIVFVGLVVPHIARFICGPDYRWILPYSHAAGADRAAARRRPRPGAAAPRASCRSAWCSASSAHRCSSRSSATPGCRRSERPWRRPR